MASLTEVLAAGNAPPIEDVNIAGNLNEGLKAGMNLATAKEQVEATKMKVADQKIDLQTKQATAMMNRTKAAMYAQSPAAFESIMKANENYANSINVPYNSEALRAAYKDPNLRLAAQREMNRIMAGGQLQNPQAIVDFFGSDSPAIFDHLQNASYAAGVKKQGQDFELEKQRRAIEGQKEIAGMGLEKAEARLSKQDEREMRHDVEKLSKRLTADAIPEVVASVESIDKSIGGLYNPEAAKKLDNIAGAKGFAAAFKIPWTQFSPLEEVSIDKEYLPLYQDVAGLRNAYLKLRSGGAVTDPEANRFLQELGQGSIRSGSQLQTGLQRLNRAVKKGIKSIEAGYDPEVVAKFREQGGGVSSESLPSETPIAPLDIEKRKQEALKHYPPEQVDAFMKSLMNVRN